MFPPNVQRVLDLNEMIRGTTVLPPGQYDPLEPIDWVALSNQWLEQTAAWREERERLLAEMTLDQYREAVRQR